MLSYITYIYLGCVSSVWDWMAHMGYCHRSHNGNPLKSGYLYKSLKQWWYMQSNWPWHAMALFWRCVNTYRQAVEFTGLPWNLTQMCMGWMGKNHTQSHFCIHGKVLSSTFRNFDIYNVLRYWLETGLVSIMLLFAWHPKYLPAKQEWTTFTFNPIGQFIYIYIYIYIIYNIQGEPGCPATNETRTWHESFPATSSHTVSLVPVGEVPNIIRAILIWSQIVQTTFMRLKHQFHHVTKYDLKVFWSNQMCSSNTGDTLKVSTQNISFTVSPVLG